MVFTRYQRETGTPYLEAAQAGSSLVFDKASGSLVGVCLVCGGDGQCGVYHIEVAPEFRRRGIARNMMKRALSVLAERGVPLLDLWCCDGSPGLLLYEELGFTATGETE